MDDTTPVLITALTEIADDHLILGHRLSEWCGHAPMLEEDLSMPNMALDLIGQARQLYSYAVDLEGQQRSEDDLAYLRNDREYRNCLLVEKGNVDFAHAMLRQFYFAAYMKPFWQGCLHSQDESIAAIAGKAVKEISYHIRHCGEWIIRLGDGTEESAAKMHSAVQVLHPYTEELFTVDSGRQQLIDAGVFPAIEDVRNAWNNTLNHVFAEANLPVPEIEFPLSGGRDGRHTEEFGYLLAELQYMQRSYPGAEW